MTNHQTRHRLAEGQEWARRQLDRLLGGWRAGADYTADGGAAAMQRLLALPEPPTAVFVANIASAIGALHSAHRLGLRVPDDVSVIAVHDLVLASHLVPPLTTVRMPLAELGARAVELMTTGDPTGPVQEVVREPTELVVRESTAPPSASPRRAQP